MAALALTLVLSMAQAGVARSSRVIIDGKQLYSHASGARAVEQEDDESEITFDNLIAAGSYTLYVELRNIGQQVRPGGLSDMMEPVLPMLGQMPKELSALAAFVNANAETLARSRMLLAAAPAKPSLPQVVVAVEMASPGAAQEIEPEFRRFIASLIMPSAGVGAGAAAKGETAKGETAKAASDTPTAGQDKQAQTSSPFFVKRAGRLMIVSESALTLKSFKAEKGKSLSDDPNFRAARDRFYSETLFVYYDLGVSERMMKERFQVSDYVKSSVDTSEDQAGADKQADADKQTEPSASLTANASSPAAGVTSKDRLPVAVIEPSVTPPPPRRATVSRAASPKASAPRTNGAGKRGQAAARNAAPRNGKEAARPTAPAQAEAILTARAEKERVPEGIAVNGADLLGMVMPLLFGGMSDQANPLHALALALNLEGDSFIIRAMLVSDPGARHSPIPFVPFLVSGPAIAAEAASYVPADTEIFLNASLDLSQMMDSIFRMGSSFNLMSAAAAGPPQQSSRGNSQPVQDQLAAFEKQNKFKVKEDLLAALGSEVAIALPASLFPLTSKPVNAHDGAARPKASPIFLISVVNKESLGAKLAPVLEAIKFKAPKEKVVTEKYGDFQIDSYANGSVAFVNNFLVLAQDAASIRRVIDAHTKNQSLAADKDFHDYMRWQPRETLAQVYVSSAITGGLFAEARRASERADDETKALFEQLNFAPEPITYSAVSDPSGAVYELRLPKNLIVLLIASIAVDEKRNRVPSNETQVRAMFSQLGLAQRNYRSEHGKYASMEELGEEFSYIKPVIQSAGYKLDLNVSGGKYEATATPVEYGKTGRLSFFVDESGVVREGDHGGRPASASDKPSTPEQEK
jgi:hypothetical protein